MVIVWYIIFTSKANLLWKERLDLFGLWLYSVNYEHRIHSLNKCSHRHAIKSSTYITLLFTSYISILIENKYIDSCLQLQSKVINVTLTTPFRHHQWSSLQCLAITIMSLLFYPSALEVVYIDTYWFYESRLNEVAGAPLV